MRTLAEIKNDFLVQNQSSTAVAFYTDTIINDWIDKAHKWAAGYKKWTVTEGRASTTYASLVTTEDGYLRGEYFEGWKPDSIRLLTIGGKEVEKKNFYKFRKHLEDYEGTDDRIYSDFNKQYFINPRIDLSGTVTAWGQYTPADIDDTDASATTVFSNGLEEANEAIVIKVQAYAKHREKKFGEAENLNKLAALKLDEIWTKTQDEQFAYQVPEGDEGMFSRIDVLQGGLQDETLRRDQF